MILLLKKRLWQNKTSTFLIKVTLAPFWITFFIKIVFTCWVRKHCSHTPSEEPDKPQSVCHI